MSFKVEIIHLVFPESIPCFVAFLISFSLCLFPVQAMNTLRVPSTQLLQTGHLNKDKLHVVVVIVIGIQNQNVLPEGKPSVSHQLLDTASVDTNMTVFLFI